MLHSLSHTLRTLPVVAPPTLEAARPRRKRLDRAVDNGTFVLPLKQSFIKDARLMPGSMRLLALLAGWAGTSNGPIETTQGVLAKHLSRSSRQIYRYLQDAMEEGYLLYSRTANRFGMITGVRIWLNTAALRPQGRKAGRRTTPARPRQQTHRARSGGFPAQTHTSATNENRYRDKEGERRFRTKLTAFCQRHGIDPPE